MPLGELLRLGEERVGGGLEVRGGAVDLHPDRVAGADERGDLGGDRERVADRGARLQAGGHADHGTPSRRAASAIAPPVVATMRLRTDRLGGRVTGERLLGVARVAGAEDHAVGLGPGGDAVAADDLERLAQPACPSPRRRGRRRSPSRPCRRRRRPLDSIGSSLAEETRQRASRRWSGSARAALELVARVVLADPLGEVAHLRRSPPVARALLFEVRRRR